MRALAERVVTYLQRQEFLHAGDRVGVAVSGGIDSVALLRLLLELRAELGIVLSVVHFNHTLRGAESDADQEFVAQLARDHSLEFHCDRDDVAAHASGESIGIEQAARDLRYGFFASLLGSDGNESHSGAEVSSRLNKIVTGHTLDDQAETVLMRMIRGTGLRGLGGIHPRIEVENDEGEICGEILRPLLGVRHEELAQYLGDIKQSWREDSTNADARFTRNRVRQMVIPLLQREFNSSVAENLSELAEIARGEEDYWDNEISGWMGTAIQWSEPEWAQADSTDPAQPLVQITLSKPQSLPASPEADSPAYNATLSRGWLLGESLAVQRRVVKAIGETAGIPLEFKHVEEILRFAAEERQSGKELSLPREWKVSAEPEALVFLAPDPQNRQPVAQDYVYELPVPGVVRVPEIGVVIEAVYVTMEAETPEYNPQHLLDAELLCAKLQVRNWRPGDRFWPAHTKSPRKIKELLQERHVAQPERALWPVVLSGDEVVWMRSFAVPAKRKAKPGGKMVLIRERPQG